MPRPSRSLLCLTLSLLLPVAAAQDLSRADAVDVEFPQAGGSYVIDDADGLKAARAAVTAARLPALARALAGRYASGAFRKGGGADWRGKAAGFTLTASGVFGMDELTLRFRKGKQALLELGFVDADGRIQVRCHAPALKPREDSFMPYALLGDRAWRKLWTSFASKAPGAGQGSGRAHKLRLALGQTTLQALVDALAKASGLTITLAAGVDGAAKVSGDVALPTTVDAILRRVAKAQQLLIAETAGGLELRTDAEAAKLADLERSLQRGQKAAAKASLASIRKLGVLKVTAAEVDRAVQSLADVVVLGKLSAGRAEARAGGGQSDVFFTVTITRLIRNRPQSVTLPLAKGGTLTVAYNVETPLAEVLLAIGKRLAGKELLISGRAMKWKGATPMLAGDRYVASSRFPVWHPSSLADRFEAMAEAERLRAAIATRK